MPIRPPRSSLVGALAGALALSLAACGTDTLDVGNGTVLRDGGEESSAPTQTVDAALAAKVPERLRQAKVIKVGSDASYAPNEFTGADGDSVVGMDVDLFTAAAQKLGLKAEFQNAEFPSIILGVTSGKYDVGVSSFTVNADRMKQVKMVQYFNAGTLWAVKAGNPKHVDPANACGLTVGVQKGTVQLDDLNARNQQCTKAGKPAIHLVIETEQARVTASLVSGKVDAMAADSPVCNYAIAQTGGQLEKLGKMYDAAPYGVVVPNSEPELAQAISEAYASLEKSGDYKKILDKWNNADGAVQKFTVNPHV